MFDKCFQKYNIHGFRMDERCSGVGWEHSYGSENLSSSCTLQPKLCLHHIPDYNGFSTWVKDARAKRKETGKRKKADVF